MRPSRLTFNRRAGNLLTRPPAMATGTALWVLDPFDQLVVLADLLAHGFLSREEFDREKAKVLGL